MTTKLNHELGAIRGKAMVKEAMQLPSELGGVILLGMERAQATGGLEKTSWLPLLTGAMRAGGAIRAVGAGLRSAVRGAGFRGGFRYATAEGAERIAQTEASYLKRRAAAEMARTNPMRQAVTRADTAAANATDDMADAAIREKNRAMDSFGNPLQRSDRRLDKLERRISAAEQRGAQARQSKEVYEGFAPPKPAAASTRPPSPAAETPSAKAPKAEPGAQAAQPAEGTAEAKPGWGDRARGVWNQAKEWGQANPGYAAAAAGGGGLLMGASGVALLGGGGNQPQLQYQQMQYPAGY